MTADLQRRTSWIENFLLGGDLETVCDCNDRNWIGERQRRSQISRPCQQAQQHARVHRIAAEAVDAAGNQRSSLFGMQRIDGGFRAFESNGASERKGETDEGEGDGQAEARSFSNGDFR